MSEEANIIKATPLTEEELDAFKRGELKPVAIIEVAPVEKKPKKMLYDEPHIELRRLNYKMENLELSLKERGVHKDDAMVELFLQARDCLDELRAILAVRHQKQIPLDTLMSKDETTALVAKDTAEREKRQIEEAEKRSQEPRRGNHRDNKPVQHPGKTERERLSGKAARYLQNKEARRVANAAHQKGAGGGGGGKGGKK